MSGRDKLQIATNRVREDAFSHLRKVKSLLFMKKVHPEWTSLSEIMEEKRKTALLFKKWKALQMELEK